MKIILIILLAVAVAKWNKWKIVTLAYIYYNEKNQYPHPNKEEMSECIGYVVKHIIGDLTCHK